jgi:DNA-directed RNA polymerase subunit RPC12/RpoP
MGKVRCLNCLKRFSVDVGVKEAACPYCETKYRISWPREDQPKIRGLAKE